MLSQIRHRPRHALCQTESTWFPGRGNGRSGQSCSARAAGLDIVNLSAPGMQQGLNRRAHHATLLPQIRACITDAAAHGIGQVIVFSGNRDGQADAEGQAACIEALRALAPDAEKAGVTLVLEMLNGFDHTDYQADRSAYGFAVVDAVKSPAVRVLYDIYHMVRMGDDPLRDVTARLAVINHLHCAETPSAQCPKPPVRSPIGISIGN